MGPQEIYKAIPAIMRDLPHVGKNQLNQQQRFKFRGIDDVYNAVHGVMGRHGVFSVGEVVESTIEKIESAKGSKGVYARIYYRFTFYAADGSSVQTHAYGEAIDYGDKCLNKCAAIAHKYALLQLFCIPTEDMPDPDKESHSLKPAGNGELIVKAKKILVHELEAMQAREIDIKSRIGQNYDDIFKKINESISIDQLKTLKQILLELKGTKNE